MFQITINGNNTITSTHLPGANGSRHSIGNGREGNPYQSPHCATVLDRNDINKLLNIDGKVDAILGNGFYTY